MVDEDGGLRSHEGAIAGDVWQPERLVVWLADGGRTTRGRLCVTGNDRDREVDSGRLRLGAST